MMAGSSKCTSVVVALLLYLTLTVVDPAPLSGKNYPTTKACRVHQIMDGATRGARLDYSCNITQDNMPTVLNEIRADGIKSLSIIITDIQDFVFGNESFSKDLEFLKIITNYPMLISSGAFRRSRRINKLVISQKYDLLAMDTKGADSGRGENNWTSLQFEPGWLMPLTGLTYLDLSNNSIERFPDMQFCHLKKLEILHISNNRINSSEGLGIICNSSDRLCTVCLPYLVALSVANNPITDIIVNISHNVPLAKEVDLSGCSLSSIDLVAVLSTYLEVLDLSHNKLTSLIKGQQGIGNPSHLTVPLDLDLSWNLLSENSLIAAGLNNLLQMKWLNLSYNKITNLSADLIGNLVNLKWFVCRGCGLRKIEKDTFMNLENLVCLKLSNNRLDSIDGSIFKYSYYLNELILSYNLLSTIPKLSIPLPSLESLILDGNNITEIDHERLNGLTYQFSTLSLAFNQIRNIPDNAFYSTPYLLALNLNNNKLSALNYDVFNSLTLLESLELKNNLLTSASLSQVLENLNNLQTIDLSQNRIRYVQLGKSDSLKTIDLSFNNISKFVCPISWLKNLRRINLKHNSLQELNEKDFLTNTQPRPQVLLQGNPLHCDCQMEWLHKTKFNRTYEEKQTRKLQQSKKKIALNNFHEHKLFYAEVSDLDSLQCTTSGSGRNSTSLSKITTVDFVCPYRNECNDWGCYEGCCIQDPNCPCRAFCYSDCSCYHNHNHEENFMNCTSRNIANLPQKGQLYLKKIYLDGNNLTTLTSDYLDFPHVTTLFLNESNVFNIHSSAFKNLKALKILALQQNYIQKIESDTFHNVFMLNELSLQDNQIASIETDSFRDLSYLRTLNLHGNNLDYLNLSLFEGMKLTELTLHNNPWSCDCDFLPIFQKWLIRHYNIVKDIEQIHCRNDTTYASWGGELPGSEFNIKDWINTPLIYIDFSKDCNNLTFVTEYKNTKSITEVAALAASVGIFMLIVIVVYTNWLLIRVWVYNQFGVRLHREETDNAEKPYDVFLAYPRQEDLFVVQHLLPELEAGNMSYRVCLEGRDWPPGADKAETIIASVQQSKRTILLVSEHHFNTQWCEFSFEAGHYQVLMDKQIRLIIILTDAKLEARMNRTMKMYTRTNAFLVVGEKWFWKKLRYYLADNPRGADDEVGREFRLMEVYKKEEHQADSDYNLTDTGYDLADTD